MEYYALCPDCGGDGNETCHNPDHGFLEGVLIIMGANESACPVYGHNPDHKITKGNSKKRRDEYCKCYTCKGQGKVSKEIYDNYICEYVPEEHIDDINEHCLLKD